MKLSVGNTIKYQPWGKEPLQTAKVEGIEICREGEKYGRQVNNVNLEKHNNGTLDLDDNHWCYFYQVKEVLQN